MKRLLFSALIAFGALGAADSGHAQVQARDCNLAQSQTVQQSVQGGFSIVTLTGRFTFQCRDGTELRADFGTLNETTRELFLSGNVYYHDPERQMTADQARYLSAIRRLHATGNVVLTDRERGSVLRGPEVEYYRTMPGRPLSQVIATGRPRVTMAPQSQRADGTEPLEIDADRVTILGEDQFSAVGRVVITRTDLHSTANEARYDAAQEFLELRGSANVRGEQFHLSGERIDASLPDGGIERVLSRRNAALVGEDLRVQAPELQLFFARDSLERMVGRGQTEEVPDGRVTALSRTFRLDADSLDALLPSQRLQQVIAIGSAVGEARDTLEAGGSTDLLVTAGPPLTITEGSVPVDRDWILGDTIIGYFSAVAASPPAQPESSAAERDELQLDRILARGTARSLYRVARNEVPGEPPSLNYLAGDTIELTLTAGELDVANVEGLRRGVYLEPVSAAPAADPAPETTAGPGSRNQPQPAQGRLP